MTNHLLLLGQAAPSLQNLPSCPVLQPWYAQIAWVFLMVCLTMLTSGYWVKKFIGVLQVDANATPSIGGKDAGMVIGKCENILVFIMVLAGQFEGLGLLFAAKSISRLEQAKKNPSYYLGGTLVNITWSLLMAFVTRVALMGFKMP
jgi:hypothetical protein